MRGRRPLKSAFQKLMYVCIFTAFIIGSCVFYPFVQSALGSQSIEVSFVEEAPQSEIEIPFINEDEEEALSSELNSEPDEPADEPAEENSETLPEESAPLDEISYEKPANAGTIIRKTYFENQSTAFIPLKNGFLKNCTTLSNEEITKTISQAPKFKIKADGTPEVLIVHTHTTESYQPYPSQWFDKDYSARTTDNTQNVTAVGDEIENALLAAGIGVIHDKTLHDYPSYNGAYGRSAETIKRILKENPTIKTVLDIHRDAIQSSSDSITAPVTEIDGKPCAQVMIIAGCDDGGVISLPNFRENLKLAAWIQNQLESDYSTITRPILFDYRKYNQDLTTGSLLLEMGGHANTLEEALYCGKLVGESLARALLALK